MVWLSLCPMDDVYRQDELYSQCCRRSNPCKMKSGLLTFPSSVNNILISPGDANIRADLHQQKSREAHREYLPAL